jgi:uncharacterized protein with FMN-binding domain
MKKKHPILKAAAILLLVLVLAGGGMMAYMAKELAPLEQAVIPKADLAAVLDGVYEGSYQAGPIQVVLEVTVQDHQITKIDLIKHVSGQGAPAEAILDEVIAAQSLQVDAVTGATYSSKAILLAIQDALTQP